MKPLSLLATLLVVVWAAAWVVLANAVEPSAIQQPSVKLESSANSEPSAKAYLQLDSVRLERDDLSLQVETAVGGRIASLRYRGRELLFSAASASAGNNWGSTFWLSPQSLWGWPPIAAHDSQPYRVLSLEQDRVTLQSPSSPEASITKSVSLAEGREVRLGYEITARQDFAEVAPWEITRVPRSGLVFYPITEGSVRVAMGQVSYSVDGAGVVWLDMEAETSPAEGKINANGREGWLAWVVDRQLYLKVYQPVDQLSQASGEGDVEIYLSGSQPYMELEVQGAAQSLSLGEKLRWRVRWLVRDLPPGLNPEVGSVELVDYVREQLSAAGHLAADSVASDSLVPDALASGIAI